jgi:hypothetical protein
MDKVALTQTVRTLVCHRHVNMAIACLGSLLKFSQEPLSLVIHDDGSLTPGDAERLVTELGNASILWRSEADAMMEEQLINYPHSRRRRYEHPLRLKLLDIPLLNQSDIAYCDSDILFFRPFSGLFQWFDTDTSAIFMLDSQEAYSIQPWQMLGKNAIHLCSRVNSGLFFLQKQSYDLDFIEWFLAHEEYWHRPGWGGQTCMSAMGHRIGCRIWHPQQISVIKSGQTSINDQMVAGHFTSSVRYLLDRFLSTPISAVQDAPPVLVETIAAKQCRPIDLALDLGRNAMIRQVRSTAYRSLEMLRRSPLANYKRRLSVARQNQLSKPSDF